MRKRINQFELNLSFNLRSHLNHGGEYRKKRKGRGHGRRLVEWVENKAVKHGALHSLLIASTLSDEDEHPAPFWEAVGYERITGNIDGDGIFAKRLA
jgi:GNAT superfamily N-acetyltransferase